MTRLSIIIGKASNNVEFLVNLESLPHLFVSYSEKEHFISFLKFAVTGIINSNEVDFSIASSEQTYTNLEQKVIPHRLKCLYLETPSKEGNISSKFLFLQGMIKELKRRKRLLEKGKIERPHIVVIEDLLQLIISNKRYTGLYFLQLLKEGPKAGIHFIIGSIRTYRNLLNQIVAIYKEQKVSEMSDQENEELLGAELIINPEELFFYRDKNEINYQRYFHLNEGVATENA